MELCSIDWLPEPDVVMARSKAAAAADLLLSPDADLRQFQCKTNWADGITMASRHDGGGSYYFVVQSGDTIAIKACLLRSSLSPDSLARFQRNPTVEMPDLAVRLINEPEFRYQELSFLAWSEKGGPWQGLKFRVDGNLSEDMGKPLLELICVGPKAFYVYGMTYHEVKIDPPSLKDLFKLAPMDEVLANAIAPEADFASARAGLEAIGYPLA